MRLLHVTSEAFPLCKTGGLADASSGLCVALQRRGVDARIMLPAYRGVASAAPILRRIELGDLLGVGPTALLESRLPHTDVTTYLVEQPSLYDRDGGPYLDQNGHDWSDNHLRFALLSRVAATMGMMGTVMGWAPQIVHAHDWQTGLIAAYLDTWGGNRPATVFSVHNLHFAGRFGAEILGSVGLPMSTYGVHGVEFYGAASYLKAGLYYSDRLVTVSPTYAREIQTPIGGEGFDGLLAARAPDLMGIVNGIDTDVWNPATDIHVGIHYSSETLGDKQQAKRALQAELGLDPAPRAPLFGLVGRLTGQKGIDLVLGAIDHLLGRGAQLAVLGSGEPALEHALGLAASTHPGRIAYRWGYNEPLSHRIVAGSDMFLLPSRFEPCGLTQMYAMRYGTIPIVRLTGGLADTVTDRSIDPQGVGFAFSASTVDDLIGAVERALELWPDVGAWQALQRNAMLKDFGWNRAAAKYEELYAGLL